MHKVEILVVELMKRQSNVLILLLLLNFDQMFEIFTAWKVSKYGVFPGPYFPVFGLNTGEKCQYISPNTRKYRPEQPPYLDSFHAVFRFGYNVFITEFRKAFSSW